MKYIKILSLALLAMFTLQNCGDDETMPPVDEIPNVSGTYTLADQMGRPAINTVFVASDEKNTFNTTVPSEQGALYADKFAERLENLSMPVWGNGGKNLLDLDAETFGGVLATDVLSVSLDGTTTFFDGTNVLTGRNLSDDVITTELTLIFGGEDGMETPTLSDDNVDGNDKDFLTTFPYLASPW